jgi:putative membrane protein
MAGFLIRLLISALGLWLAAAVLSGIYVDGPGTLIIAALLLGIVNAIVRPLLVLLTLPITILTLGLFLLVVNAGMFALVAWVLPGFSVSGFWAALLGGIIVSLTAWAASWFIGPRGYVEVMVRRPHGYRR